MDGTVDGAVTPEMTPKLREIVSDMLISLFSDAAVTRMRHTLGKAVTGVKRIDGRCSVTRTPAVAEPESVHNVRPVPGQDRRCRQCRADRPIRESGLRLD